MAKNVEVEFSDEAWQQLDALEQTTRKSKAEILRDAIALEKWFNDAKSEGKKILVQRGRDVKEVVRES